ncbi:class F sortase, partial [[Kitasatospora] papulosa]
MTFSLVTGIVWASSDSSEDTSSVTAARGSDAAGGGARPDRRAPLPPAEYVATAHPPRGAA